MTLVAVHVDSGNFCCQFECFIVVCDCRFQLSFTCAIFKLHYHYGQYSTYVILQIFCFKCVDYMTYYYHHHYCNYHYYYHR